MKARSLIFDVASRYSIAVLTVAAAFALTYFASSFMRPGISPLFILAVMISAWRGGLGVGLFATFLSVAASAFIFLPPVYSFDISQAGLLHLVVFTVAAVIVGSLSAARKQAEEAREILLIKEQTARGEAEQASRVKDEFLAAVSHELRTPLTTIKTLTRVMQRREMTEDERAEYLADIASECDREIDLVLNLLDLSRIKAGGAQIQAKRANAGEAVRACEKLMRGAAEQRNQKISVEIADDLPFVRADHSALRRALCAIAENAIKFTPEGGRIWLRAEADGARFAAIEIEDDGRGIAAEDLPRVFEKFYRGHNAGGAPQAGAEDVPGIGLGLNLAQTLIEGMNGTIEAASGLGRGAKFVVRLPVWTEEMEKTKETKETKTADDRRNGTTAAPEKSGIAAEKHGKL